MEDKKSYSRRGLVSESFAAVDVFRRVMKAFVILGMLVSTTGLCIMAYMWAYPEGRLKTMSHAVPFWLIVGGSVLAVLAGLFSQIAAWWKRYQRNGMIQSKVRVDSSLGTSYDADEGRSLIGNVDSTAAWASSAGRASAANFSAA